MNQPIKLIRLITGEDIITQITEEKDNSVKMINPMVIMFKRLETGKALILMTPWIPIEIVSDNVTQIYKTNIMCIMDARKSLIDHYTDTVEKMADIVINDDELEMSSSNGDEDDEEYDDDFYEEETKEKNRFH